MCLYNSCVNASQQRPVIFKVFISKSNMIISGCESQSFILFKVAIIGLSGKQWFQKVSFKLPVFNTSSSETNQSLEALRDPCQTSKMERFANIVNCFHKRLHRRCLTVFWKRMCLEQDVIKETSTFAVHRASRLRTVPNGTEKTTQQYMEIFQS